MPAEMPWTVDKQLALRSLTSTFAKLGCWTLYYPLYASGTTLVTTCNDLCIIS